jgi:oligoribonuclease NrnB/cAMP/cGMP phosphodiesterase (DHH superfamily)
MAGEEYIKKNKLKTMTDKQFAILATVIKNVYIKDGDSEAQAVEFKDVGDKVSFIENLNSSDMKCITDYVESLNFGVALPFDFKCTNCDHESKEEVNVAVFFIS